MHFHLFPPPPPFHIMPLLLTAAMAFAAGMLFVARRGVPHAIAGLSDRLSERFASWRHSCLNRSSASTEGGFANSAFEEYRRATLQKLEDEAGEFRTFLDRLRRAADASDFEAFLKSRRNAAGQRS